MQAVILAAGMGRRLKGLTKHNTKCMVEVNGRKIIDRMLDQLSTFGIQRTVIVVGYFGEELKTHVGQNWNGMGVEYIENPIYDKTNNIYSLSLASEELKRDDTILLESDLVVEDSVLEKVIASKIENLAVVDKYQSWMDGTCVMLNDDNSIRRFVPKKDFKYEDIGQYFKTVNIYRFSKEFSRNYYVPFLMAYQNALGRNEYYEQVLKVVTLLEKKVLYALPLEGEKWYEIDDIQDLDIAETIFCPIGERVKRLAKRYGGYWRFPELKDFTYLVNPYFPTAGLMSEMKNSFDVLVQGYPSGQGVVDLLAAKTFGLDKSQVVVGNGASEIISSLMRCLDGKIGFIYPTFEEYPNRIDESRRVVFNVNPEDGFRYTCKDLMRFFQDNPVGTVVLINPDNPSGNFIGKDELLEFVDWTENNGTRLLVDESFVDFAEQPYTLLDRDFLNIHTNVCVMKSISKSYGVPGLRLGVFASGDGKIVERVRSGLSIWNINSFGEFFLQIVEKYSHEYMESCKKMACERDRFMSELEKVNFIKPYPSEANYILCEVFEPYSSQSICQTLLSEARCLIKDCSGKKGFQNGHFIRLAVKSREDNDWLVGKLKEVQ